MKPFLIFILFGLSPMAFGLVSLSQSLTNQQLIEQGREAFLNRCSGCHGSSAEGNGPASVMLNPRPRNLVAGSFKFRSTPSGILPTVADLLRTLEQGIIGTSMPSFKDVSAQEKLSLVAYIRSLRAEFNDTKSDQLSVPLPSAPKEIFASKAGLLSAALKGKAHYTRACVSCHGESGRGDGPSAADLTDSDNQPIRPADFSKPYVKSGTTAQDLYKALSTGLDGSPMPGFVDLFNETQRWELTAYLYYFRGLEAGIYNASDLNPTKPSKEK